MPPLPATAACTFRCSPILNPRAKWRGNTAPIVPMKGSANARCLCSIDRGSLRGAIALRSRSIPAPTEFSTPSKNSQIRPMAMANLRTPITKSDHVRGPESAPITLVEYGDYECPHKALANPIADWVLLYFSGRIGFVFRHFPMTEVHPHAEIAAESAEFAGAAGLFWDMHDALFRNQGRLSVTTIFLISEDLGLSEAALRHALETGQFRNKVRNDFLG